MHRLGSRPALSSSRFATQTFLSAVASRRHDLRPLYLTYVYLHMYIKYTCVRARARGPRAAVRSIELWRNS